MKITRVHLSLLVLWTAQSAFASGNHDGVHRDLADDAVVRRTDAGNDAPLPAGFTPIDLLEVRVQGWETNTPQSDPYMGDSSGGDACLMRLQILVDGLVCPPGPVGLDGSSYAPYLFGDRPLYGYIELDVDDQKNSGGEFMPLARNRYLANVGRFGLIPYGSISDRIVRSAIDVESNFSVGPQFERTGGEFTLALCGCFTPSIVSQDGNMDSKFDAGETWIVRGRFFERFVAFAPESGLFGGSDFGHFDPIVNLQFKHDINTDQTSVTLVFPVTNEGAALLLGQSEQQIDSNLLNQTSIAEALDDLIFGADFATGDLRTLVNDWRGREVEDYYRPRDWGVSALIGTAPTQQDPNALFIWTDTGFDEVYGDFDGDDLFTLQDNDEIQTTIHNLDGGPLDADGMINDQVQLSNFAREFSIYDLNYDGILSRLDIAQIPEYVVESISVFSTPTTVRGVSEAGHVVGDQEVIGLRKPFVATKSFGLKLLPLPAGYITGVAFDANSGGVIVGTVSTSSSPLEDGVPAIWSSIGNSSYSVTIPQQFVTIPNGQSSNPIKGGQALVVNEKGTIVGWSRFEGTQTGPATRFSLTEAPIDLDAQGFVARVADINDYDFIVGDGLLFDLATSNVVDLGLPPEGDDGVGFVSVSAYAINNQNQIVAAARRDTITNNRYLTYIHDEVNGWQPHNIKQYPSSSVGFYDNNAQGDVSATGGTRFGPEGVLASDYDELLASDQTNWLTSIGFLNDDRRMYTTAFDTDTGLYSIVVLVPDDLPQVCIADLNGDGALDFFDVSAFLVAYNQMHPLADFNGDGMYNFFDVSAFLVAYLTGCP